MVETPYYRIDARKFVAARGSTSLLFEMRGKLRLSYYGRTSTMQVQPISISMRIASASSASLDQVTHVLVFLYGTMTGEYFVCYLERP
jgi:hypothetical protein